jgi:hypothetical protein
VTKIAVGIFLQQYLFLSSHPFITVS